MTLPELNNLLSASGDCSAMQADQLVQLVRAGRMTPDEALAAVKSGDLVALMRQADPRETVVTHGADDDDEPENEGEEPMRRQQLHEILNTKPITATRRTILAKLIEQGNISTKEILGVCARMPDASLVAFIEGVAPEMLSKAKSRDDDQEDDDEDDEECDEEDSETMKRLAKLVACVSPEKLEKAVEKKKRAADDDDGISAEDLAKIAKANGMTAEDLKKAMSNTTTRKASVDVDDRDTVMGRGLQAIEQANRLARGLR